MATPKKIVAGSLLMLILIASGFGLGVLANKRMNAPVTPSPVKPNTSVYQASPTSQGRLNMTIPVTLVVEQKVASVALPSEQAKDIEKDQPVLLYDKDNSLLPIIGRVVDVIEGKDQSGSTDIRIRIDDGPNAPADQVVRGEIVYKSEEYASRLPVSAIVYHNDESAHIWTVVDDGDGGRFARLKTFSKPPVIVGDFLVMDESEYSSSDYILNPDDKLKDDQPITVTKVLYEPAYVPSTETIQDRRVGWVYKVEKEPDNSGCETASTCGGGNGITNFIDKIKSMAAEDAKKHSSAP